jgi:nucleoside-diphosphate-sugar epimerase
MKVLVTGAEGFVGQTIVEELSKKNVEVFCLARPKSERTNDSKTFFRADIVNLESLKCLDELKNIDGIIHSAGLAHQFDDVDEKAFWQINVEGTKNIALTAARLKAKHFILISSVSVYGKVRGLRGRATIDEDSKCEPEGFYAQSKLEAEKIAIEICEKNNVPLTILRLATVIGERDRGNTARLIKVIDEGRFFWIGKGENYKSLVYKNDAAQACISVLDKKTDKTEIFNVTAAPVSMKEIVSEIARHLKKRIPEIYIPKGLLETAFRINAKILRRKNIYNISKTVEKWLSDDVFSGEKIARAYGFRAETTVSEAIGRQIASFQKEKKL